MRHWRFRDAGDARRVALPQTGTAEPAQTSGAATGACQEEECSEPARGRLCDEHRDIAQTDSCYVILRVGKRKGRAVRDACQGRRLMGRHAPKQAARATSRYAAA